MSSPNSSTADTNSDSQLKVEVIEQLPSEEQVMQEKTGENTDFGYKAFQDLLGISHPDNEEESKLKFIWDFHSKGRSREEVMDAIMSTYKTLSPPIAGESYLHKLYSYTRLMEVSRGANNEMKHYKSGSEFPSK